MEYEESIYSLIPRPQEVPQKPPMHKSKFPATVHPKEFEFGQNKLQGHATMGRPLGTNSEHPLNFTRKHSKEPILPDPAPPSNPKDKIRPPVPKKEEKPVMGLTSNKNYITANAVEVILAKPKKPEDEFVWTQRQGYGQVPMYLKRNKAKVAEETAALEAYLKMREPPSAGQHVSELEPGERANILRHLKLKWQSVNQAYQKLSISTDSEQKKHRKEGVERQLAEIEKDIKTLERGDVVLVFDD